MRKIVLLLLLTIISCSCLRAQRKEISQARADIKNGANLEKSAELMKRLLAADSTNHRNDKIYMTWFAAVEKMYAAGNEKLYLKQSYDTAALFNYAYDMFCILEKLDSVETVMSAEGGYKMKYREKNSELLNNYRPNLYYGGSYFVRKGDYKRGFTLLDEYINTSTHPMFGRFHYADKDTRLQEAAYWATYCGYMNKSPESILRHAALAEKDTAKLKYTLRYESEAYHQLNDTDKYLATLKRGFKSYPEFRYFFPQLIDYYSEKKDYGSALDVANEALQTDSTNILFLFAKSTLLLNMEKYDESMRVTERILHINDTVPQAYFNMASALLNKVLVLENDVKKNKTEIKALYTQAMPYMEKYRALAPDQKEKWAPALYRIYLNLNMGKQFEEIDKIINI